MRMLVSIAASLCLAATASAAVADDGRLLAFKPNQAATKTEVSSGVSNKATGDAARKAVNAASDVASQRQKKKSKKSLGGLK